MFPPRLSKLPTRLGHGLKADIKVCRTCTIYLLPFYVFVFIFTGKSLSEWRAAESKSKKQSFVSARENEKLQDVTLDVRLGGGLTGSNKLTASSLHLHQKQSNEKESSKVIPPPPPFFSSLSHRIFAFSPGLSTSVDRRSYGRYLLRVFFFFLFLNSSTFYVSLSVEDFELESFKVKRTYSQTFYRIRN